MMTRPGFKAETIAALLTAAVCLAGCANRPGNSAPAQEDAALSPAPTQAASFSVEFRQGDLVLN